MYVIGGGGHGVIITLQSIYGLYVEENRKQKESTPFSPHNFPFTCPHPQQTKKTPNQLIFLLHVARWDTVWESVLLINEIH